MDYTEALNYLSSLSHFGIKPGLQRMEKLLAQLGNPEKQLYCIHVAGTNGKGSVNSMLSAILTAGGYKAGSFTSPHLVKWNERIGINGQDISDEKLAEVLGAVKKAVEDAGMDDDPPSQFEVLTAAALLFFAREKVDIAVIEVGLGGLLDSTNIIRPLCCVITNVTFDHMDRCGETIEEIAEQKAGIIKQGVPVVTAAESVALSAIIDKAAPAKAELYVLRKDFISVSLGGDLYSQSFFFRQGEYVANYTVSLGGDHQVANAALAVMTARLLAESFPAITDDVIKTGLLRVNWPGRLEKISDSPEIVLDGAHNIAGAMALRFALNKYRPGRPVVFVIGIMRDKDVKGIVEELLKDDDVLIAVPADDSPRAAEPELLASFAGTKSEICWDAKCALKRAGELAGPDGLVVAAGSLYLVGQIKSLWTKSH